MAEQKYLWYHGIDLEQDAVIQAALVHWRKTTRAIVSPNVMLKIIVMEYARHMTEINESIAERNRERKPGNYLRG